MALQTQKRTKSSKKRRASHFALSKINLGKCSHCHQPVKPHHACANCGYYQGREVVKKTTKLDKKKKDNKSKS